MTNNWYSRGYMPHFAKSGSIQSITWRLLDTYPKNFLKKLDDKLKGKNISSHKRSIEWRKKAEITLDKGLGECLLNRDEIATMVQDSLLYFDNQRYRLCAWCIMPNHVHVLADLFDGYPLAKVVHSWRSFTAHQASKILGRKGSFWARGYWDRFIRNQEHFDFAKKYIEMNPVKAGLCEIPEEWRYSSAGYDSHKQ